jgi:hypothetical protein
MIVYICGKEEVRSAVGFEALALNGLQHQGLMIRVKTKRCADKNQVSGMNKTWEFPLCALKATQNKL